MRQKEDYFRGFEIKIAKKTENLWIVPQKKRFRQKSRRIDMTGTIRVKKKTKCMKKRKFVDNICVCLSGKILDIKSKKKQ